jgi:2-haloacid dehalogenase
VSERWATFDCYGTLIDWNAGIRGQLVRVFGPEDAARLLERYHEVEPELQRDGERSYREVLTLALRRLAAEEGAELHEPDALARSLPEWPAFPEVPAALGELRARGWRAAILSNTDRDLIAASQEQIGVPFDLVIVAEEIRSYKPAHGHWIEFFERSGAERARHVHVAASLFHDVRPARELGLPIVWINRLGEQADPEPDRELPDLGRLADTLDELVPE